MKVQFLLNVQFLFNVQFLLDVKFLLNVQFLLNVHFLLNVQHPENFFIVLTLYMYIGSLEVVSLITEPLADAGQLLPSTVKKWNEIRPRVKWTLSLFFHILAQESKPGPIAADHY